MKRETWFLKLAVIVLTLPVIGGCALALPHIWREATVSGGWVQASIQPIVIGMYVAAVPFFYALYQTFKLLGYIDQDEVFSLETVRALRHIKYSAVIITAVYAMTLPFFYWFAERDDAPGFLLIGLVFVFASFVVAVFAELLQKLLRRAIDMKQENDLTV